MIASISGAQLTGVDLVSQQIASAQKFNKICRVTDNRCTFKQASAERLPFPDAYFDSAYEIEVFAHIDDKLSALTELARVLKKGAKVVFADFTKVGDMPDLERLFPESATSLWCSDNRKALLSSCGFEIREIHNRSLNVAEGYSLFVNLFKYKIRMNRQTFIAGLQWWTQNKKSKSQVIRATSPFLKFCRHRKEASLALLNGEGRQRIFDYCSTMIPACQQGIIKYEVVVVNKI
jgi:SAM-dependent methyltransferase